MRLNGTIAIYRTLGCVVHLYRCPLGEPGRNRVLKIDWAVSGVRKPRGSFPGAYADIFRAKLVETRQFEIFLVTP